MKRLLGLPLFRRSKNMVLYASLPGEVDTWALVDRALSLKKNVFLPRMNRKNNELEVFQIRNPGKELKKGYRGIWEPRAGKSSKGKPGNMDLILVPGLGFDRSGARLGRGKGYFDRFLKKTPGAVKIGIAFQEQVLARIPAAAQDVTMDKIITDAMILP